MNHSVQYAADTQHNSAIPREMVTRNWYDLALVSLIRFATSFARDKVFRCNRKLTSIYFLSYLVFSRHVNVNYDRLIIFKFYVTEFMTLNPTNVIFKPKLKIWPFIIISNQLFINPSNSAILPVKILCVIAANQNSPEKEILKWIRYKLFF